jgi:hypothetical protein
MVKPMYCYVDRLAVSVAKCLASLTEAFGIINQLC